MHLDEESIQIINDKVQDLIHFNPKFDLQKIRSTGYLNFNNDKIKAKLADKKQ